MPLSPRHNRQKQKNMALLTVLAFLTFLLFAVAFIKTPGL
jgi:hypothetical protein